MISTEALIAKFQFALDNKWGYIYGKTYEMWTDAKQREYERLYSDDEDRQNSCKYGGKWVGRIVTDCSGLFSWSFKQLGGYMYHGSNTMWSDYCTAKGELKSGKRTDGKTLKPGTAVFTSKGSRHNHVGLYIGGNTVIEAMGAQNGVTTTKITNSKWTHWGELKGVDYQSSGIGDAAFIGIGDAASVGIGDAAFVMRATVYSENGGPVRMRNKPTTDTKIWTNVPFGSTVMVTEKGSEWSKINYNKQSGYMMTKFLKFGDEPVNVQKYKVIISDLTEAQAKDIANKYPGVSIQKM